MRFAKMMFMGAILLSGCAEKSDTLLPYCASLEKCGYINESGKVVISPVYADTYRFNYGIAPVKLGEKYGFIDNAGALLIEPKFDTLSNPRKSPNLEYISVNKNNKYGVIGFDGRTIVPIMYENPLYFRENGLAKILFKGRYGVINTKGVQVIPPIYKSLSFLDDGRFIFSKNEKYGLLDVTGKVLLNETYNKIDAFEDGTLIGESSTGWSILDNSGNVKLSLEYNISSIWGNFARIYPKSGERKLGVANSKGSIVIPLQFKDIAISNDIGKMDQNDPAIFFKRKSSSGFMDTKGNVIFEHPNEPGKRIEGRYEDGTVAYHIDDLTGLLDRKGEVLLEPSYDYIGLMMFGYASFEHKGKWGVIDVSGKQVLPPIYDSTFPDTEFGYIFVEFDNKQYFTTFDGEPIGFDLGDVVK